MNCSLLTPSTSPSAVKPAVVQFVCLQVMASTGSGEAMVEFRVKRKEYILFVDCFIKA